MKIIHLRYLTRLALVADVERAFPNWDKESNEVPMWLDRHAHIKVERDPTLGTLIGIDMYLLVQDNFTLPVWVTGQLLTGQRTHGFLGHD